MQKVLAVATASLVVAGILVGWGYDHRSLSRRLDSVEKQNPSPPVSPVVHEQPDHASDYRKTALDAARWIQSTAIQAERGKAWPSDPADPKSVHAGLYGGVAGIVLFFLEAYHSTHNIAFLEQARMGADYLMRSLEEEKQAGLYEGLAGIGFALHETFKVTGDAPHRLGARRCLEILEARAKRASKGVEWNDTTDIIAGSAGIGLFLLYGAREIGHGAARELALQAGERLIELGQPASGGLKWAMNPRFGRLMPNFSHGTAGVAYFLASLYLETKQQRFLEAALAGARYLQATCQKSNSACLIMHHEPGGEELFYLGWCHGPVGTARLFYRLYQATGERIWLDWVERCARGILQSGIPEQRTAGLWDNDGQCCGAAGVAEFFLDVYRITQNPQYLAFSWQMGDELLRHAWRGEHGTRWPVAEHRVRPHLITIQTGFMQGASGIGMSLLHLNGFSQGKRPSIRFPDSPF